MTHRLATPSVLLAEGGQAMKTALRAMLVSFSALGMCAVSGQPLRAETATTTAVYSVSGAGSQAMKVAYPRRGFYRPYRAYYRPRYSYGPRYRYGYRRPYWTSYRPYGYGYYGAYPRYYGYRSYPYGGRAYYRYARPYYGYRVW